MQPTYRRLSVHSSTRHPLRTFLIIAALVAALLIGGCSTSQPDTPATTSIPESVIAEPTTTTSATVTTATSPSVADETVAVATLSLELEDGTRVEGTFIDQDDLGGAFCAGYVASFRQMERDAHDTPDDFYLPLPTEDDIRKECATYGTPASAATVEQSFCLGRAANAATGTKVIAESPDLDKVILVLVNACMGSHFATEWNGTPAYDDDHPIIDHALFAEGVVCYPLRSWIWTSDRNLPYEAACPIGFDVITGEMSVGVAVMDFAFMGRQGSGGVRDEDWFYEAYLLGAALLGELIETSVLGDDEAILGGDTFCVILATNAGEGQSAHDGTLMAIKEMSFLLGIADSHATLLGAFAAGALCDEAAYQYALELFEEVARG